MARQVFGVPVRESLAARGLLGLVLVVSAALLDACGGGGTVSSAPPSATSPQTFELSVNTSGNGTVTSSPGGIACGGSCAGAFGPGTPVTLQAAPATGYLFTGWTGACTGSSPGCTVTMTQSQSVSAVFAPQPAGVAVVSGGLVVAGTNTPFVPEGFNSDGMLYPEAYAATLCPLATPLSTPLVQWLEQAEAALTAPPLPGLAYNASFQAMVQDWHANTVRIHVSQGALQYEYAQGLSSYTDMARSVIAQARAAGLIVIVDMQAEKYGCTPDENGNMQKLPDLNQTITDDFIQSYLPQHSIGVIGYAWDGPYSGPGYMVNSYDYPGNTANFQLIDPDPSGCPQNGASQLQQLFLSQSAGP